MAAEKKQQQQREKLRRCSCQVFTLLMNIVKLYAISLIQGSMTVYNTSISYEHGQIFLKMTFLFGLIIFGNIVDNVSQPKWVNICS